MHKHEDRLASRAREVRLEKFGDLGVVSWSQQMQIPARTGNISRME
jgi:hypothetical protein